MDGEVGKLLEAARRERRAMEKELNDVSETQKIFLLRGCATLTNKSEFTIVDEKTPRGTGKRWKRCCWNDKCDKRVRFPC